MADLFSSGRIADLILAFMALECMGLMAYRGLRGSGPRLQDYLSSLLAGAGLVTALRLSLAGAHWRWVAACLLVSLLAHLDDMRRRWSATTRV